MSRHDECVTSLYLRFPDLDLAVLSDLAESITNGQLSYEDGIAMLEEMYVIREVQQTADGLPISPCFRTNAALPTEPHALGMSHLNNASPTHLQAGVGVLHPHGAGKPSVAANYLPPTESAELDEQLFLADEDFTAAARESERGVLTVYTSSVGGIRKIKDDIRRLRHLLDTLQLKYNEIDVADNKWLIEKVRQMSGGETTLPSIFVDERYVGTFDTLQAWNEEGILLPHLVEAGYS